MERKTSFRDRLRWLYPGMQVKRWLLIAILGVILISIGLSLILSTPYFKGTYITWNRFVFGFLKSYGVAVGFGIFWLAAGTFFIIYGLQRMNRSIISAIMPSTANEVAKKIYIKRQLERGPNIVVIGGGHGLHTLLQGIKQYTSNTTAVVTVFDDGGSSGRLRNDMGVLPPGDIRNCLIALADAEPLMSELFQHRFDNDSEFKGHNFGNIFIAALTQVTGDFQKAVAESSKVLAVRGRVLPTTLQNVVLKAECEDGTIISGESKVGCCGKRINRIFLDPDRVVSTPEVLKAIEEADLIVLGPGSLYTSVLCNLSVREVRDAVMRSTVPLVFVCNITTQPGETDHYGFSDHLEAIFKFLPPERLNYILVNGESPTDEELTEMCSRGVEPVTIENISTYDSIKIFEASLLSHEQTSRHDSEKLARALIRILTDEKPTWNFYFTLYTNEGFKNLKIVQLVNDMKERKKAGKSEKDSEKG
ncbi:MAG: YvcK family protein [Candidatus Atribacteria bacterium]|nr:YvcK family protein [Candidatus Atribacteria bacterium]